MLPKNNIWLFVIWYSVKMWHKHGPIRVKISPLSIRWPLCFFFISIKYRFSEWKLASEIFKSILWRINSLQLRFSSLILLFWSKSKFHLNTNALDCANFPETHLRLSVVTNKMQIIKLRQLISQFRFFWNLSLISF